LVHELVDDHQQIVGHHIFIAMCCSDSNFVERYPLFRISLPVICVKIVELEVSWPDDNTKLISEWSEAGDTASTRCIAVPRCAMCFVVFPPVLHLRRMTLFLIVFDAIPQIQIGAKVVTEVTSRLLHFLVGIALSTMAATAICNALPSMTCVAPALLITFAPFIDVMLVSIAPSALILRTVRLIVNIVALVKIRTSSLLGALLEMTLGGGR
jgi:hypothetical protein